MVFFTELGSNDSQIRNSDTPRPPRPRLDTPRLPPHTLNPILRPPRIRIFPDGVEVIRDGQFIGKLVGNRFFPIRCNNRFVTLAENDRQMYTYRTLHRIIQMLNAGNTNNHYSIFLH